MGNMVNIVRAAIALDHPILPAALELIEPFADLVVFEGIGAGLYGAMARFVAEGCRAVGRADDAVGYAERALAVNRALGGVLVADALRTLASCTGGRRRRSPGGGAARRSRRGLSQRRRGTPRS